MREFKLITNPKKWKVDKKLIPKLSKKKPKYYNKKIRELQRGVFK